MMTLMRLISWLTQSLFDRKDRSVDGDDEVVTETELLTESDGFVKLKPLYTVSKLFVNPEPARVKFTDNMNIKTKSVLGINIFENSVVENLFIKWKLYNPLTVASNIDLWWLSWAHHTEFAPITLLIWISLILWRSSFIIAHDIGLFILGILGVFRNFLFNSIFRKWMTFSTWTNVVAITTMCLLSINIISTFINIRFLHAGESEFGDAKLPAGHGRLQLREVLSTNLGSYTAAETLGSIVDKSFTVIIVAEFFPWPWGVLVGIAIFTGGQFIMSIILRRMMGFYLFLIFEVMLFNMLAMFLFSHYGVEDRSRTEFELLLKTDFSNSFIDNCVNVCLADVKKPLTTLVDLRRIFLTHMMYQITHSKSNVSLSVINDLNTLNRGYLLLNQLLLELEFQSELSAAENVAKTIKFNLTEAILLRQEIVWLVNSIIPEDSSIRIYLDVDPDLLYINFDVRLLKTVFIYALSQSMNKIKRRTQKDPRTLDLVHEIVIIARPHAKDTPYKFLDLRLLSINILDTGDCSEDDHDNEHGNNNHGNNSQVESFRKQICDYVVSSAGGVFNSKSETKYPEVIYYSKYHQSFMMPYKINQKTNSAKQLGERRYHGLMAVDGPRDKRKHLLAKFIHHRETIGLRRSLPPAGRRFQMSESMRMRAKMRDSGGGGASTTKNVVFILEPKQNDAVFKSIVLTFEMHGWVCEQLVETKHLTILPQVLEHADCVVLIERSDEGKAERENI